VATGLTLRYGPEMFRQLQEAKDSLADLRLPGAEKTQEDKSKAAR